MYNPCSMGDIGRPCLRWEASTGTDGRNPQRSHYRISIVISS
jgi:hypothetical protein